ncbi:hypothetical protein CFP56_029900 [Quercus suber]|uniref:DC1 domain-containing protein n=1 Tax=Quercus suber TaxID=58331 RepID=A0AAW0JRF7_QUESU
MKLELRYEQQFLALFKFDDDDDDDDIWSGSSNRFNIFAIRSIPCSSIKMIEVEKIAMGATKQFMDFNLHITCASLLPTLEAESELHDHPLIRIWKWITFTCNICGKEDKGMPFLCNTCGSWIHRTCVYQYPHRVKVVRHKHLLHLTHSSLEFHQPDSRICQICVQKVDTRYRLFYCSRCNFIAHLECAIAKKNREDIDLSKFEDEDSEVDESIDLTAPYEVKKFNIGKDKT